MLSEKVSTPELRVGNRIQQPPSDVYPAGVVFFIDRILGPSVSRMTHPLTGLTSEVELHNVMLTAENGKTGAIASMCDLARKIREGTYKLLS